MTRSYMLIYSKEKYEQKSPALAAAIVGFQYGLTFPCWLARRNTKMAGGSYRCRPICLVAW